MAVNIQKICSSCYKSLKIWCNITTTSLPRFLVFPHLQFNASILQAIENGAGKGLGMRLTHMPSYLSIILDDCLSINQIGQLFSNQPDWTTVRQSTRLDNCSAINQIGRLFGIQPDWTTVHQSTRLDDCLAITCHSQANLKCLQFAYTSTALNVLVLLKSVHQGVVTYM